MIDILSKAADLLTEHSFSVRYIQMEDIQFLVFEDATTLGFVLSYDSAEHLLASWESQADHVIASHQFGLRHAGQKAWNAYLVLLAAEVTDYSQTVLLGSIEENLVGTRKIARGGVIDMTELRAALLPLLPIQAAPQLEAIDIASEIRRRTTELPSRAIEAFLSQADEGLVVQVLEEAP